MILKRYQLFIIAIGVIATLFVVLFPYIDSLMTKWLRPDDDIIQLEWKSTIRPAHEIYDPSYLTSSNSRCITKSEASSCVFEKACVINHEIYHHCPANKTCHYPRLFSYSRHSVFHIKGVKRYEVTVHPMSSLRSTVSYEDGLFVLNYPYLLTGSNVGHYLGDDIFAIFQALKSFNLHHHPNIIILIYGRNLSPRVIELYHSVGMKVIQMNAMNQTALCARSILAGLSGMTFTRPLLVGQGLILDNFQEWLFERGGIRANTSASIAQSPRVTVLQKDFSHSSHLHGLRNGAEIVSMLRKDYPSLSTNLLILSNESTYLQTSEVFANTDILISSPGSDLMNGVYMRPGTCVIIVCYCKKLKKDGTCDATLGLEYDQWFAVRSSMHFIPYCDLSADEIVDVGHNTWNGWSNQPWHQILVTKTKLEPLFRDCLAFLQNQNHHK